LVTGAQTRTDALPHLDNQDSDRLIWPGTWIVKKNHISNPSACFPLLINPLQIQFAHFMKLKATFCAMASAAFLLIGVPAFAVITVNLTFDAESLAVGTTGTFTISGGATSNAGLLSGWSTSSNEGGPASALASDTFFSLSVVTLDATPSVTYNGGAFTPNMVGQNFLDFDKSMYGPYNNFTINGSSTLSPGGALFQIGNGTTDFISGTFTVSNSNIEAFTIANLNSTFGTSNTFASNIQLVVASVVPEPSSFAGVAGLAALAFGAGRRRRGDRG
jgi:hypothetical protein